MGTGIKRLLILTNQLQTGGLERVILAYGQFLDRRRYDVTIACYSGGEAAEEAAKMEGIRFVLLSERGRIARFIATLRLAMRLRVDLIHNHACWYGILISRLLRIPGFETVHNQYGWFNWHERLRYGVYCRLADRVIAVSHAVKAFTVEAMPFLRARDILVIHNGIDIGSFLAPTDRPIIRARYGYAEEHVVIGFLGRLTEQKGVIYLLSAAGILMHEAPSARILVIGDGELREGLESEARSRHLSNVTFAGFQPDAPRYLGSLDIFVLPSLWEGLAVSVLEAMAAGLPVVATRVSGTPEAVEEGVTGYLVEPRDVEALAGRLGQLARDSRLRSRLGAAGAARVRKEFSADDMVRKTEALYDQILGRPPANARAWMDEPVPPPS